jgi:hypothetical protein
MKNGLNKGLTTEYLHSFVLWTHYYPDCFASPFARVAQYKHIIRKMREIQEIVQDLLNAFTRYCATDSYRVTSIPVDRPSYFIEQETHTSGS